MGELEEEVDVQAAIEKAEVVKERLKSDPNAVRKILTNAVTVEDDVTVYPNKDVNLRFKLANDRVIKLGGDIARLVGESDEDFIARNTKNVAEYEALQAEFDAIEKEVEDSAVTFHFVSIGKKALKRLQRAAREKFDVEVNTESSNVEECDEYYRASVVAAHLVQDGYTIDDVLNIIDQWPTRCWAQLWTKAQELSIADDFLGNSFTPDF